ncbi:putative chitin synthase 7 [Violaceomyces palustris]|uniref:Chitin synthase 7 n=1 Tax=Violaceomyces palustris TaxID=1673888 RepID=A0ACD0NNW0_9BASI|nr:putative chitin synthase 7 [Violaceomyces palustris]
MRRNAEFTKSFVRRPGARESTAIPIRNEAPPPLRQPTKIARSKTLTRPERGQPQVPLINPSPGVGFSSQSGRKSDSGVWKTCSLIVTFWAPAALLSACGGLKDKASRQAWREKVTLVFIALCLGAFIGFITMGLNATLCPSIDSASASSFTRIGTGGASLGVDGWMFDISAAKLPTEEEVGEDLYKLSASQSGYDVTPLFRRTEATDYPSCQGKKGAYATTNTCAVSGAGLAECPLGSLSQSTLASHNMRNTSRRVGYGWEDVASGDFKNFIVLDGNVLNLTPYLNDNPDPIPGDVVDSAIRKQLASTFEGGKDATRMFYSNPHTKEAISCLIEKFPAGGIDKITPGCFVSNLVLYSSLVVILGIVFLRFFMAVWFSWFMSWRMTSPPPQPKRRELAHNVMPEGAMVTVNSSGAAPWANKQRPPPSRPLRQRHASVQSSAPSIPESMSAEFIGSEPYVVCLVTAYSEGEDGISTTLTSLAETEYSDSRKLLFVVADGMVTGSGESMSTPDICVGLLDADPRFGTPIPMSFISVAQGAKSHNMAMVYAGHYTRAKGRRTPMIVVVKCGTPEEASDKKPGNRGKRDSQMILMNFFQRVTYNDQMSPLDFDLFRKVHTLMGVTPDFFELCLMVDADTMVYPKSMKTLANCMMHDHMIMGACGETRIANKTQSWVTAIQVYEYFISHHQAKAFESVFGGVTCLPGCFSMYRIKARKPNDDDWVPVIVKPEVTREYSQSTVTTLHQKNLLLLGEDRFLTTLLLRTFPNRKMVFCPQARCRTEVPHTFKMLLSQRRRWINSTIHNLMELVLVRDLCGTFCFSMQFVVFMDLLGTAVLPVAIALTYTLVVTYCLNPPNTFTEAIPLMLLIAVIGMPAILILLATRKVVYVLWMLIYLVALPVWNFVLPVYAFWHFDDFSWGETRKVEGEGKDLGHIEAEGVFAAANVPLRRWEDWERSRLRKLKREEKRRRELERQFGQGFYNDSDGDHDRKEPGMPLHLRPDSDSFSDTVSDVDEDRWGAQIGGYDESLPPPLAIVRHSVWVGDQERVLGQHDLEMMLEKGWDDTPSRSAVVPPQRPSAATAQRSRFSLADTPVPKIPSRFSQAPKFNPGQIEMERTPSPGEYASLMRGTSQPPSPGVPHHPNQQPYAQDRPTHHHHHHHQYQYQGEGQGHSSAIDGASATHARNRSQGNSAGLSPNPTNYAQSRYR